jgi:hypothetical protein
MPFYLCRAVNKLKRRGYSCQELRNEEKILCINDSQLVQAISSNGNDVYVIPAGYQAHVFSTQLDAQILNQMATWLSQALDLGTVLFTVHRLGNGYVVIFYEKLGITPLAVMTGVDSLVTLQELNESGPVGQPQVYTVEPQALSTQQVTAAEPGSPLVRRLPHIRVKSPSGKGSKRRDPIANPPALVAPAPVLLLAPRMPVAQSRFVPGVEISGAPISNPLVHPPVEMPPAYTAPTTNTDGPPGYESSQQSALEAARKRSAALEAELKKVKKEAALLQRKQEKRERAEAAQNAIFQEAQEQSRREALARQGQEQEEARRQAEEEAKAKPKGFLSRVFGKKPKGDK